MSENKTGKKKLFCGLVSTNKEITKKWNALATEN